MHGSALCRDGAGAAGGLDVVDAVGELGDELLRGDGHGDEGDEGDLPRGVNRCESKGMRGHTQDVMQATILPQ